MAPSNWTSPGSPGAIPAFPSVGKNADGSLEAFVWTVGVDAAKDLWHIGQTTTGGTWSSWFSSSGPQHHGNPFISHATVRKNEDGRLESTVEQARSDLFLSCPFFQT